MTEAKALFAGFLASVVTGQMTVGSLKSRVEDGRAYVERFGAEYVGHEIQAALTAMECAAAWIEAKRDEIRSSQEQLTAIPPQPEEMFRVTFRFRRKREFEIFGEYPNRYAAEDVAKELVTSGYVVETKAVCIGDGVNPVHRNRRHGVTFRVVKGEIQRSAGTYPFTSIGTIEQEATMKSNADHEKDLADMRERQRDAARDREIALQSLYDVVTPVGREKRTQKPSERHPPYMPPAKHVKNELVRSINAAWDSAQERVVLEATYLDGKTFTAILTDPDGLMVSLQRALTVRQEFQYGLLLKARAAPTDRIALRPPELAKLIGCSGEFVRSAIKAGRLKARQLKDGGGGAYFILVEDAYAWMRGLSEPAGE